MKLRHKAAESFKEVKYGSIQSFYTFWQQAGQYLPAPSISILAFTYIGCMIASTAHGSILL